MPDYSFSEKFHGLDSLTLLNFLYGISPKAARRMPIVLPTLPMPPRASWRSLASNRKRWRQVISLPLSQEAYFGWIAEYGLNAEILPPKWTMHMDASSGRASVACS